MFSGRFSGLIGLLAQAAAVCFWGYSAFYGLRHVPENAAAGFLMAGFSLLIGGATAYCIYRQTQFVQEDAKFKAWMIANAEKIRTQQPVFYRSQRITPDTELVRHHLVFSALVMSFRMRTRWIIKGQEPRFGHALAATLYTLIYGWWGFPFGLFWTPVALFKNLTGYSAVRVGDLLQPAPGKANGFGERVSRDYSKRLHAGFFLDEKAVGILPPDSVKA
ncbi:MAG TPA: hypothetical protein VFO39_13255 [Candidatus Sulfotelmatobacter sp.]|nr:hypothetical protein [Candidatus Sulfotelmatobacter sp.]